MAKMTEREVLALVDREFTNSMGGASGEISDERAKSWNAYLSKPLGNEVEGESSVRTSDVADVVDSIMPSLLRIFTTADNLVAFDPEGPEDEEAAKQESDYVNYVFFKQNDAFLTLYTWFFDALVQKNGIVKAWWDESEEVTTESYSGLTDEELAEVLSDEEVEPIGHDERQETIMAPGMTQIGVIPQPQTITVHDIELRRTSKKGQARVEGVPPEEFRISQDARSVDPSSARMVGQEREVTRSELIDMGFDKELVDSLPAQTSENQFSPESEARHDKTDEDQFSDIGDRSQDLIRFREAYIRCDYDGDGRSELRQIQVGGGKVLANEPADRQPFHVICPKPLPHKHFGRSVAELVQDIQDVNTTLLRQVLNNLYRTNQPGHAVWDAGIGENTIDDLLTERIGRIARFNRPVNEAYKEMTVPFTAAGTFPMLEYFDKVKRDRTGVHSDSEGLSPDALKNIQTTVLTQAVDMSKQKIEAIARIFAETGIKSLFLHLHELLSKHQDKESVVKLRNQWVSVDPTEWRHRYNMTVKIGLGIGTREQKLLHLEGIRALQKDIAEGGGMNLLLTPQNIYNTASEYVRNANLDDPGLYFTDPGDQMAPPPSSEQEEMAKMQMQIQARQQELDNREQQLDIAKLLQKQEEGMEKLRLQADKQEKDFLVAMENVANALTKMELDSGKNVPGAKV